MAPGGFGVYKTGQERTDSCYAVLRLLEFRENIPESN